MQGPGGNAGVLTLTDVDGSCRRQMRLMKLTRLAFVGKSHAKNRRSSVMTDYADFEVDRRLDESDQKGFM